LQGAFGVEEEHEVLGLYDHHTRSFLNIDHICKGPETVPKVITLRKKCTH
jgi:hypothetical protein